MAGGRSTTSSISSRSAGWQPTAKSYKKWFLFMKEWQWMYNFYKVANRLTPAVCCAITSVWQTNQKCTAPSQVHRRPCYTLEGSALLRLGDVGGDVEAQDQLSPQEISPEWETLFIPVIDVWTLSHRRWDGDSGTESPCCTVNFCGARGTEL